MKRQTRVARAVLVLVLTCAAGCAAPRPTTTTGPARRAPVSVLPWTARSAHAAIVSSPRYTIYTTLPAGAARDALPQVLEGAYAQYQALAPAAPLDDRPMHCFVFADRAEWEEFTDRRTGGDATMYRQIPRGGYTIDDWFAAWSDSDRALFNTAAHEGWHQYVARHFAGRLPPFLDEGIACLFEEVRMVRGLPRWDTSLNPFRAETLSRASRDGDLWSLDELVTLDAGDVMETSRPRINAFYAQSWAFARFLNEAEDGRYRPMLQNLLADAAAGKTPRHWAPAEARAALERYLEQDFVAIERSYGSFVSRITNDAGERVR